MPADLPAAEKVETFPSLLGLPNCTYPRSLRMEEKFHGDSSVAAVYALHGSVNSTASLLPDDWPIEEKRAD